MKSNPFESAKLLLNRAREHREEFRLRSQAFFDENPYTTIIEFDRPSDLYILKARLPRPLPPMLWSVAADAFNNLRHALDQAICASAIAMNPSVDLTGVGFGFGKTPENFKANMRTTRNKIAPEIFAAMTDFEPYKRGNGHTGGDDEFWALSELSRFNKHRSLIALSATVKQMNLNLATVFSKTSEGVIRPFWNGPENELIAGAADHPDKLDYDLGVTFYVVIGDIEILGEWPALAAIDMLAGKVERVLTRLEADTRRIFPAAF